MAGVGEVKKKLETFKERMSVGRVEMSRRVTPSIGDQFSKRIRFANIATASRPTGIISK
jgi:hypothetical protein